MEAIYEPVQMGEPDALRLMDDQTELEVVDFVARGLGLQRVGFILAQAYKSRQTENGSTDDENGTQESHYTMSSRDLYAAAKRQSSGKQYKNIHAMCCEFFVTF